MQLDSKRKLLLLSLAALLLAALGIYLGFWQLGRAAQKETLQATIQSQAGKKTLDQQVLLDVNDVSSLLYQPVRLTGQWVSQSTIYLDNRQMEGKVGFFVLTPLRLEGSDKVIVVQRGWAQRNFEQRETVPLVETPSGLVQIEGNIALSPSKLYEPGQSAKGLIRQNLDMQAFRGETGLPLLNFTVRQTGLPSEGLRRNWPAVNFGIDKHYGYAFQWFGLSALVIALYLWFQIFRRTIFRSKDFPLMSKPHANEDQPLGLTVHSMPNPQDLDAAGAYRTSGGRWKMLLVLLVCAAPVIASYFTYYVVRPEGRRNFGQLIDPQQPLPDVQAIALDGSKVNLRELKGQWLLVSVAGGTCDDSCTRHLYLQRQLREGLGKEKDRLDWVWLVSDDIPVAQTLRPALQTATVLRVAPADLQRWLKPQEGAQLSQHLFLVDPIGNWMMRFPAALANDQVPQVKRDIERLLRASAFWDNEGR
jgi:cytochrome oxidase assembly protein ShyY1